MSVDISEKISYLQGLSAGLNISDASPQGKIISGILAVLDDMAATMVNMRSEWEDFKEDAESIQADFFNREEGFWKEKEFIEMKCQNCGKEIFFEVCSTDDDEDGSLEITCPSCNEIIFINDGSFDHDFTHFPEEIEFGNS
ncbi:MAG: AraC family transcriptional regulator [Syntrophomonadaceae bacterium]|jgi:DNA-directed RNA polymerase subunit RPC12/RpoP|nr:AraC family transcriptional regulator [Syntrophomonadaceae bacterium]